jgi:hypothetical protein
MEGKQQKYNTALIIFIKEKMAASQKEGSSHRIEDLLIYPEVNK